MQDHIDVLPRDAARLAAFRGRVLDPAADGVLDAITAAAAQELRASYGLVSLLLENVLLHRAAHAPEGKDVGAMSDSDLSICQYVVRDRAVVEVPDAVADPRVPRAAIRDYGVGAYLGAPVYVGSQVVGSLCVFDLSARVFHEQDKAALVRHAEKASARLNELAAEQRGVDSAAALLRAATRPTFQDLRNALWQLSMSLDQMRVAAVESGRLEHVPGARLVQQDGTPLDPRLLSDTIARTAELRRLSVGAQQAAERLQASLLALEAATQRTGTEADLAGVVHAGARLADHFVKLVGGLSGAPPPGIRLAVPASAAIVQVSTALATLATALLKARVQGALLLSAAERDGQAVLRIRTLGSPALHAAAAAELKALLGEASGVSVGCDDCSLSLAYRGVA